MYLRGLVNNSIDDEKVEKAKRRIEQLLDSSVSVSSGGTLKADYKIHEGKVINLAALDITELKKELKRSEYKAILIDDLKQFIEEMLQRMINKNRTRIKFSERYKSIIDRYNAGGTENEDYYEQLVQLIQDLKKENARPQEYGLNEEEQEIFDLLAMGKELTKDEKQKVILSAKNLYKKLSENKNSLFVADWYKDPQPKEIVRETITDALDDLPESYDAALFNAKADLLLNHFIDMSVQGYGWV